MSLQKAFGLNFTALVGCGGFLLISLMASHWLSIDSDLVLHILYGRVVIADGLRAGRARERQAAVKELKKKLRKYG